MGDFPKTFQSERELACAGVDFATRRKALVALAESSAIASQVWDTVVCFAVLAVEPKRPVAPEKTMNVAIAGELGFTVGVGALLVECWGKRREPCFKKHLSGRLRRGNSDRE
jgi:hypothetical protein